MLKTHSLPPTGAMRDLGFALQDGRQTGSDRPNTRCMARNFTVLCRPQEKQERVEGPQEGVST
jgi:hypothetical protein